MIWLLLIIFKINCHQAPSLEGDHNDRISNDVNHVNLMKMTLKALMTMLKNQGWDEAQESFDMIARK